MSRRNCNLGLGEALMILYEDEVKVEKDMDILDLLDNHIISHNYQNAYKNLYATYFRPNTWTGKKRLATYFGMSYYHLKGDVYGNLNNGE